VILEFSIDCGPGIRIDDEMRDTRMTPEVAEDYMRRMREQVIAAYQEIGAFDTVLNREDDERA
jgi:hypothetical protein